LIPEVQEKSKGDRSFLTAIFFLLGILFISLLTSFVPE